MVKIEADYINKRTGNGQRNPRLYRLEWHALYFYDPACNIVELIARHNPDNTSDNTFAPQNFLELSEVGVVSKAYAQ